MYLRHLAQQRFESEVSKVRQSFIEKATASELLAINLQNFAQIDPNMTRDAFQIILEGVMSNYNFVRSSNFYRLVPDAQRQEHEAWLAANTDAEELVDSSSDDPDATLPAATQDFYLSLIYADLRSADNTVFGWNVQSDSRRKSALEESIRSAKASASDGFLLDDGHAAIEVFVPFYKGGKIPEDEFQRQKELAGIIGMTIDLPLLLGDEEWRKNVTLMLQTSLAGSDRLRDLFRSLDKEPEGIFRLGGLESQVDLNSFGQSMRLIFLKDLYVTRLNYGILFLIGSGCIIMGFLAIHLARTLVRLAKSLDDLASLNAGLEQKVTERTRDLAKSNTEIQEILDNLDDGILLINKKMQIEARFSPATPGILGVQSLAESSVKDLLFAQLDPHQEDVAKHNFTLPMLFGADEFQWNISCEDLLKAMSYQRKAADGSFESRQFSLRYAPLYDEKGKIQHTLLVISDVTEVLALRRIVEESKNHNDQRVQMLMEVLQADRRSLLSFMQESALRSRLLRDAMQKLTPDFPLARLQEIFREVHTFKGNARMVKLQTISREAHKLEDAHAEWALSGKKLIGSQGLELIHSLEQFLKLTSLYEETFHELFGSQESVDHTLELRREWLEILKLGIPAKTLSRLLEAQNQQEVFSFAEIWKGFQSMVDDISRQLSKQLHPLHMRGNIYLHTKLQSPVKDALTHLIRNALDHGIESPEQRVQMNKPAKGSLQVNFSRRGDELLLDIHDDGRGVDCEKVWQLAQSRGVIAPGTSRPVDAEVLQILFHPGFSTKAEVSEMSGRGVGLDAARNFLSEFNCRLEITSQIGKGTNFRLVIPLIWVNVLWNDTGLFWDAKEALVEKAS